MSLPTDSRARKAVPLFEGFIGYFPDAMAEVARLSVAGNEKHSPGQPLHWDRSKSTDHADCIIRHQVEFDAIDEDDGFHHAAKVAWRAMAQLQELLERVRGLPPPRNAIDPPADPDSSSVVIGHDPSPSASGGAVTIELRVDTSQIRDEVSEWLAWLSASPQSNNPAKSTLHQFRDAELIRN